MKLSHNYVSVDGVKIHYVESGPRQEAKRPAKTMVFLHGFPEYWGTWSKQLSHFGDDWRVIAPDLPGYNLSDKPTDLSFYAVPNLINFMGQFIAAISPSQPVTLVAHDWGGVIAWPLAAFKSHLLDRLIILNAAHPSCFTREMISNPHQREKSAYIHQLISPHAESLLANNHFNYLTKNIMVSTDPNAFNDEILATYRHVWRQQGAINGMLNYYRAMPQLASVDVIVAGKDALATETSRQHHPLMNTSDIKIPNIRILLPTLVLWGEQDLAFVNENLDGLCHYVPHCTIRRFPLSSHWLQHEQPDAVNQAIRAFTD